MSAGWWAARVVALVIAVPVVLGVGATASLAQPENENASKRKGPKFAKALAFDKTATLRELAAQRKPEDRRTVRASRLFEIRPEMGPSAPDRGYSGDGAVQRSAPEASSTPAGTIANFEGLSNQDNLTIIGGRVNPPDTVGDVGPNHYVEMINLVFAVYSKTGDRLLGPIDTGTLWANFPVEDCTDASGDPIVIYDQITDRWILSQFTTRGLVDESLPFYNCVAISTSGDPTGSYYRYAFPTGLNFPDYPKYGVWRDSYVITTREFGPTVEYGIGVYALEKNKMVDGDPDARVVSFYLDGNDPAVLPLIGDGLLPADIDGKQKPKEDAAIPLVGTQDDDARYGATFDALNIWDLDVKWRSTPTASLELNTQLAVAEFDSIFPCPGGGRRCLPQPGVAVSQFIDILSYRQRPTWRLAYRNFKSHEALVTSQSVEGLPGQAGMRWYEVRRTGSSYVLHQQGTYAPADGVHRWMGSVAQDKDGNLALGYSVVNGTDVFPGIRFTGRLAGDALGQMTQAEGVIVNGTGVQRTTNSRWGDYTSMNVDPVDDCTFWYANQYYTLAGQITSAAGWQTRIASFRLPGCK